MSKERHIQPNVELGEIINTHENASQQTMIDPVETSQGFGRKTINSGLVAPVFTEHNFSSFVITKRDIVFSNDVYDQYADEDSSGLLPE